MKIRKVLAHLATINDVGGADALGKAPNAALHPAMIRTSAEYMAHVRPSMYLTSSSCFNMLCHVFCLVNAAVNCRLTWGSCLQR